jgi:hypothetical protein
MTSPYIVVVTGLSHGVEVSHYLRTSKNGWRLCNRPGDAHTFYPNRVLGDPSIAFAVFTTARAVNLQDVAWRKILTPFPVASLMIGRKSRTDVRI